MQCIKQLDGPLFVGCMICLYTCLYDIFEALRDEPSSVGCTCPNKASLNESFMRVSCILNKLIWHNLNEKE